MATVDSATTPVGLREQLLLVQSIWRVARRYPKAAVWLGGAAAVAYLLVRRTKRFRGLVDAQREGVTPLTKRMYKRSPRLS